MSVTLTIGEPIHKSNPANIYRLTIKTTGGDFENEFVSGDRHDTEALKTLITACEWYKTLSDLDKRDHTLYDCPLVSQVKLGFRLMAYPRTYGDPDLGQSFQRCCEMTDYFVHFFDAQGIEYHVNITVA